MRSSKTVVTLLLAAMVGGAAALAIGWATGLVGPRETVVQSKTNVIRAGGGDFDVTAIYKKAAPSVVLVSASGPQGKGLGSGFVIDPEGHVVTNQHVVDGGTKFTVTFADDRTAPAKLIGSDASTDIAVLQVDAPQGRLTPIAWANSATVEVGQPVIAIGNPYGLELTVTSGIISAVARQIAAPNGLTIDSVLQTDAALNKGNSGGPLIDGAGEVVGVNSQIQSESGGFDGIGYAVPSNTAKRIADDLIEDGKVESPYLGIQMEPITPELAKVVKVGADKGVLVTTVAPRGPAAKAGLRGGDTQVTIDGQPYLVGGDVITRIGTTSITDPDQLRAAIQQRKPGEKVTIEVLRNGNTKRVEVTLGQAPTAPQQTTPATP